MIQFIQFSYKKYFNINKNFIWNHIINLKDNIKVLDLNQTNLNEEINMVTVIKN